MLLLFFILRDSWFILTNYHCLWSLCFVVRLCSHLVMTPAHSLCYGFHYSAIFPDDVQVSLKKPTIQKVTNVS